MKTLLCSFLLIALAMTAAAADLTGKWSGTFTSTGSDGSPRESSAYLVLKQTGAGVTGTAGPDENRQWPLKNGKLVGNKLTAEAENQEGIVHKVTLILDGDRLKGDVEATRPDGQVMKAKLDVGRIK